MNTGSALAKFTVTLSTAVTEPVQVEWHTSDGTAKAGVDFAANKGTVVFAPGETAKAVDIMVYGRAVGAEDRSFYVEMLPPTNAILGASIGECIITVDTSGSTPVTTIIVPTGPVGPIGKSAYQSYRDTTTDNPPMTETEWVDSLKGDPAEIALEVTPLIDVGATVLVAEGTEALSKPDSTTVKAIARRVAYAAPAKIATVVLADGDNSVGQSDMTGDALDLSSAGISPRIMRGSTIMSPAWSVTPEGKILIKGAIAGDVLYVCQYDFVSGNRLNTNTRELWRRSLAEAGLTLVAGSFEEGATANSKTDAVWHMAGGQCYSWSGTLPKVVPANSTPATSGGGGSGEWVSVGDASSRVWAQQSFYTTGLNVITAGVGDTVSDSAEAVFISGRTYPLSISVSGAITEINLVARPAYLVAGGVKSHLLDINWFRKGEINTRSYWCATDGMSSDSDCLQAMIDDIPAVSDTQTASNVYFDKPDISYHLAKAIWIYEKDYTNFIGDGAAITKFSVDALLDMTMPANFSAIQGVNGNDYTPQAAFVIAGRRRTQSPSQGYIPANQAAWGLKWSGMSFNMTGAAKQAVSAFNAPQYAKSEFKDIRVWCAKYGILGRDFYLVNLTDLDFAECYQPIKVSAGTSIVANKVAASNCAFGYRIRGYYHTLNGLTNDHWGKDKDGTLMTNSYAYDIAGVGIVLNGCGAEIGYGGVLKYGNGIDDADTAQSTITMNGCYFIGGSRFSEANYTGQVTLADFGVSAWGLNVANNCKIVWNGLNMRNTVESTSAVVADFSFKLNNGARCIITDGIQSVGTTLNRLMSIHDFEPDATSSVNSLSITEKPVVQAVRSANLVLAADNNSALNFDTEIIDTLNAYAGGHFSAPVKGMYRIAASISYSGAGLHYVAVNGISVNYVHNQPPTNSAGCINFNIIAKLTKGVSVAVIPRTASGSSVTVYAGASLSIEML